MSGAGMSKRSTQTGHSMDDVAAQNTSTKRSILVADIGFGFGFDTAPVASAVSPQDVAAYLADMLIELRQIAQQTGFETLGRVLEIAEREAKYRMEAKL